MRISHQVSDDGTKRFRIHRDDGTDVSWTGLQTGPLTLTRQRVDEISRQLLGVPATEVGALSERVLVPAVGERAARPALILHSTTPDLKTFDGDLDALLTGGVGGDFTTYKEARSVYLAAPGDIAVGRTAAWRTAVDALEARAITLEDSDHYYLSHALLALAASHEQHQHASIAALIDTVRERPHQARLYAFELEMQIFLLYLARAAGVDELAVEANSAAISAAWNRKDVLHPAVARAAGLDGTPDDWLAREGELCTLAERMGLEVPRVPGYTLERSGRDEDAFAAQAVEAARLLRQRHGLELGCLKASESGDAARITPGLELADLSRIEELARRAHVHGDYYVLEAHVHYGRVEVAGQTLPTALSGHIRGGDVAPGLTAQFMEGTSWKGNLMLDEEAAPDFGVAREHYRQARRFLADFRQAFAGRAPGLALDGLAFAIGRVGGRYGECQLVAVQDLNISFTGAECLRSFLDKVRDEQGSDAQPSGVTRIYRPLPHADHHDFLGVAKKFRRGRVFADAVAAIPGRWGMVGITGEHPRDAIENLGQLEAALVDEGLIAAIARAGQEAEVAEATEVAAIG